MKYVREEYVARINWVIDYIDKHIDEELRLEVRRYYENKLFPVYIIGSELFPRCL